MNYDYQYGYCHYFADVIINKIRELVPNDVPINYYLILADRFDDEGEVINEVLIHAYIKIKDYYLDSEGFHTKEQVDNREKEWSDREETLTPDGYSFNTWQEETDIIPIYFFNKYCKTTKVKKDIEEFISQPTFQEFIGKIKDRTNL